MADENTVAQEQQKAAPTVEDGLAALWDAEAKEEAGEAKPDEQPADGEEKKEGEPEPEKEKPAEEPKKDEKAIPASKHWAEVNRLDADARRARQEVKSVKAEVEQLRTQGQQLIDTLKSDPIGVLRHLGFTDEALAAAIISGAKPAQAPPKSDAQIEELRKEIAELKAQRQQESVQSREQAAINEVVGAIREGAEQFELCAADQQRASRLAIDIARAAHEEYGHVPPLPEILAAVEQHLLQEEEARIERLAKSKRFGSRFAAKPAAQAVPAPAARPPAAPPSKSIPGQPTFGGAAPRPTNKDDVEKRIFAGLDAIWSKE